MRPSCCIQKFRASGSMSHSNGDVGINCDQIRKQNLQKCDSFIQTESKCESQPVQATPVMFKCIMNSNFSMNFQFCRWYFYGYFLL